MSDDPDPRYRSTNVDTAAHVCETVCDLGLDVKRLILPCSARVASREADRAPGTADLQWQRRPVRKF